MVDQFFSPRVGCSYRIPYVNAGQLGVVLKVDCPRAVELISKRLDTLPHEDAGLIRLMQFSHDSAGLRLLRRQIGEAIVGLLETEFKLVAKDA